VPGDPEHPFAFRPREVTVKAGQTVRWVNDDNVFHTVMSTDSLNRLRPNGRFNRSLSSRGQIFDQTAARERWRVNPTAPGRIGAERAVTPRASRDVA
jgi:plastocyanin